MRRKSTIRDYQPPIWLSSAVKCHVLVRGANSSGSGKGCREFHQSFCFYFGPEIKFLNQIVRDLGGHGKANKWPDECRCVEFAESLFCDDFSCNNVHISSIF